MKNKPIIFISHITEETELAKILKENLTRSFIGMIDAFVSPDGESIRAGKQWFDQIKINLSNADLGLIICSKTSIQRPWVNFEAGACFIRGIPVIPVCHTDVLPRGLPAPLNQLQGVNANEVSGLEQFVGWIVEVLGSSAPEFDWNPVVEEIKALEKRYRASKKNVKPVVADDPAKDARIAQLSEDNARLRDELESKRVMFGGLTFDETCDYLSREKGIYGTPLDVFFVFYPELKAPGGLHGFREFQLSPEKLRGMLGALNTLADCGLLTHDVSTGDSWYEVTDSGKQFFAYSKLNKKSDL